MPGMTNNFTVAEFNYVVLSGMSGHSKWATTFRQKSVVDSKRGAVFTKLARAITIAARSGPNPESNFKLRLAIDQARAANMPKDIIERAIQRGGGPAEAGEAVTYEGFGPYGVAVIAECLTDNRNRTGNEIRHLIESSGGRIGTPGSVSWQFERAGIITVPELSDDAELAVIDAGATDIRRGSHGVLVHCAPAQLEAIRQFFIARGVTPEARIALLPKETKALTLAQTAGLHQFLEALDGHPDVQEVYHNGATA